MRRITVSVEEAPNIRTLLKKAQTGDIIPLCNGYFNYTSQHDEGVITEKADEDGIYRLNDGRAIHECHANEVLGFGGTSVLARLGQTFTCPGLKTKKKDTLKDGNVKECVYHPTLGVFILSDKGLFLAETGKIWGMRLRQLHLNPIDELKIRSKDAIARIANGQFLHIVPGSSQPVKKFPQYQYPGEWKSFTWFPYQDTIAVQVDTTIFAGSNRKLAEDIKPEDQWVIAGTKSSKLVIWKGGSLFIDGEKLDYPFSVTSLESHPRGALIEFVLEGKMFYTLICVE